MTGITYAIISAVENYNEPQDFPKVDYAKKDAENFIETLKLLGYDESNFVPLIKKGLATKTAILQKVKYIAERAKEEDRIIFYFAGHGFYENGKNLLAPVDAVKIDKSQTCIPIEDILGVLKKSLCKQNILFIDSCHSGFVAGTEVRDGEDSFMADELIYLFRNEEYCVGFASCKSNQKSISHPELQNGVWSHFLNKALRGEASGIYNSGLLFSDKLQGYLNKETSQYVKLNTKTKRDQTPIKFGSETDKFIIADINPIFEERNKSRNVEDITFTNVILLSEETDDIKKLPGFQKGFHSVPTYIASQTNNFVKDKGKQLVDEEISNLSEELKSKLEYKRNEIRAGSEDGYGSIETRDFDYSIEICQSENDPTEYVLTRKLENFKNSEIVFSKEFNKIFERYFDKLEFELSGKVDILKLIDRIEDLPKESPIKVYYTPSEVTRCKISIVGLDYDIDVTPESFSITSSYQTSPENLIAAFKQTKLAIASNPSLKVLE